MKGKVRFLCTAIICLVAVIAAGVLISVNAKKAKVVEAVGVNNENFTFVDVNNVILSVEKVAVNADDDTHTSPLYTTSNQAAGTETNRMLVGDSQYLYYQNIANDGKDRYVLNVDDNGAGGFIMLNNNSSTPSGNPYNSRYANSIYDERGNQVQMGEAILVSLGQYVFYQNGEDTRVGLSGQTSITTGNGQETLSAKLTSIDLVSATINGRSLNIQSPRQFGNYYDLAFLIPQTDESEGFYSLTFRYYSNNRFWNKTISFYLINESSYNASVADGNNQYYQLYPTLSFDLADGFINNSHHYFLGRSLTNYPTITYDISKYLLTYTHKANGITTSYSCQQATNSTSSGDGQSLMRENLSTHNVNVYPMGNYVANGNNVGVLVFTEPGEYTFTFEYLYKDKVSGTTMNVDLQAPSFSLVIHGYELDYSPYEKMNATMKKLTFAFSPNASTSKLSVGLAVMDGYLKGQAPSDLYLGVMYDLDTTSRERVGTIVSTEEASIQCTETTISANSIDVENLKFTKSNQPTFRLSSNETYVDGQDDVKSFYYYGINEQTVKNNFQADFSGGAAKNYLPYNNTVTFAKTGYYLVFILVNVQGIPSSYNYYQIFAFQYTAEMVNVQVKEMDTDKVLGSFEYTNKDIVVSWQQPGTFERNVNVRAYSNGRYYNNNYSTTKAFVADCRADELTNSEGSVIEVPEGSGQSVAIEIKSEGISASYTIINIDKEPISNVQLYEVERAVNLIGNTVYRFKSVGGSGETYYSVQNAITNSIATLFWADKASGAPISAYYSFTPFVKTNSNEGRILQGTADVWNTTNYKLGQTVGLQQFTRATVLGGDLNSTKVLTDSGIYLFTLTDRAGNSCKYMFVIDKTEAFFLIKYQSNESGVLQDATDYLTGGYKLYTRDVTVEVGTHKAFALNTVGSNLYEQEVFEFINLASSFTEQNISNSASSREQFANQLQQKGYYVGNANHLTGLAAIFNKYNNSTNYLTVKNTSMLAYNSTQDYVAQHSIPEISGSAYSVEIKHSNASSTIRNLFVLGVNQHNTAARNSNSNITIEINTDNSRGMAYFGNNINDLSAGNIPTNGASASGATRLFYEGATGQEFEGTHATGDNFLAFTWQFGTGGKYEVETVVFDFYELMLQPVSSGADFSKFFYSKQGSTTTLYDKTSGTTAQDVILDSVNDRAIAILQRQGTQTRAGLYVITRTYVTPVEDELDQTTLTYYFIVDRNGIIEIDDNEVSINGGSISLGLKNNQTKFNNFNSFVPETGRFRLEYYDEGTSISTEYTIYLETNRLPAVLNIPVGKYFYNENYYSNYYAGKLNFSVFYVNNYAGGQQIVGNNYQNSAIKLFSVSGNTDDRGYFKLDFNNIPEDIKNYFIRKGNTEDFNPENDRDNNADWLCLPGDYVVVIGDNVQTSEAKHTQVIGFRILSRPPQTEIYAKYSLQQDDITSINAGEHTLLTNQEYVFIELNNDTNPLDFVGTRALAQLDLDYLYVTQTLNGQTRVYIDYQHNWNNGENIDADNEFYEYKKNPDGSTLSRKIMLDTLFGQQFDELVYEITIRYNISGEGLNDYANSYYYFDEHGVLQQCYYVTYTITIDREPPKENLQTILAEQNQEFVANYLNLNSYGLDEIFATETLEGGRYFVRRYANYEEGDNSTIFALKVNNLTPLKYSETDTNTIFTKMVDNFSSLELAYKSSYYDAEFDTQPQTFGDLGFENGHYYQIMEQDKAGNSTVYVVFYDTTGEQDNLSFTMSLNMATGEGIVDNIQTFKFFNDGDDNTITAFNISANNEIVLSNDRFFLATLTKLQNDNGLLVSAKVGTIKTYLGYNFANLSQSLVNMFYLNNALQYGNYVLTLQSRSETVVYNINVYSNADIDLGNASELVEYENGEFARVNLSKAVKELDGIYYYAKTVTLRQGETVFVYECVPSDAYNFYWVKDDGTKEIVVNNTILKGQLSGTYELTMVDCFNKTYPKYHYPFSTEGKQPCVLNDGSKDGFYETPDEYYSFNRFKLDYDAVLYNDFSISYTITINNRNSTISGINRNNYATADVYHLIEFSTDGDRNILFINPYYDSTKLVGGVVYATVVIVGTNSQLFSFVLNSDTGNVALRTNNQNKNFNVDINVEDISTTEWPTTNLAIGTSELSWTSVANDYFVYSYKLYQEGFDGFLNLNNTNSYTINTSSNASGVYRFVVEVSTIDGKYLGNKVYTFVVQTSPTEDYYVTEGITKVVKTNIKLQFAEIANFLRNNSAELIRSLAINMEEINKLQTSNKMFDLYISVNDLTVNVTEAHGLIKTCATFGEDKIAAGSGYRFEFYRIYSLNEEEGSKYLGVLKVAPTQRLVESLQFAGKDLSGRQRYQFSTELGEAAYYELTGVQTKQLQSVDADFYPILNKNSIVLEVAYNREDGVGGPTTKIVTSSAAYGENNSFSFKIYGSGKYTFKFKDVAGNEHIFTYFDQASQAQTSNEISIELMLEVVVLVNGDLAVDNAYYNGEVHVKIYQSSTYDIGTILEPVVTLNGREYHPEADYVNGSYSYVFTDVGIYQVIFEAKYTPESYADASTQSTLRRVLVFTIVNPNEVRRAFDITSISSYNITSITFNDSGVNKKDELLTILAEQGENNHLIDIDLLLKYSYILNIASGNIQHITITYQATNENKITREITFTFALNDVVPTIECTLKPGETSTKGFTITYNPQLIYSQVGDCQLLINNQLIAEINESSASTTEGGAAVSYTVNYGNDYKEGDYYVVLRGMSPGNVHVTFKVSLKEPLNRWSIVFIVVVVLIFATIIGVIIFLRTRMKIR